MIWKKDIEKAREMMGEQADEMTDKEIEELLYQLKKMVTFAIEYVERGTR